MQKYRKKPIIIEAEQWFPGKKSEGVTEHYDPEKRRTVGSVKTLEGHLNADSGDWIITGVKGEKYPCKPDIFEATYEKIEEGAEREKALIVYSKRDNKDPYFCGQLRIKITDVERPDDYAPHGHGTIVREL